MKLLTSLSVFLWVAAVIAGCSKSDTNSGGSPSSPSPSNASTGGNPSGASNVTVNIPPGANTRTTDAFGANPLAVQQGTMVTWVNTDAMAHTVSSLQGTFDSGTLNPGQSFSFTFNTPGVFPYSCEIHPNMTGTVQVVPTPAPAPTPTAIPTPMPTHSPMTPSSPY